MDIGEEKWIGDGGSLWLMPGYLDCSEDGIYGTFDFTDAERNKVAYIEEANAPSAMYSDDETDADIMDIAIKDQKGGLLRPIKCESGILYMKESYFDIFTDKAFRLMIRDANGENPLIMVYEGLILIGAIAPYSAASVELCDSLEVLWRNMAAELGAK